MKPADIALENDREIYKGDYYRILIYLFADEGETLQDLSGYSGAKAQIRFADNAPGDPLAEFTCTIAADQVANRGLITAVLTEVKTAVLNKTTTGGTFEWDFEIVDPAGHKETWIHSYVIVDGEVTVG